MSIFRNDVSSNYFIDGTCSESAFFDTIDNTIMLVDEASEIVNEKSFGEVVKDIKDGIIKLFKKFIETIKGLWQKFIDSITKFFEEHNLGTLIGGHLDKSLDKISDDTINKANEILSKSKVWGGDSKEYIPVLKDIYSLANSDSIKYILDANKVIGNLTLISQLSSYPDKISNEIDNLYADERKFRDDGLYENNLNADIDTCNNHVNEFKDCISKYSVSFNRKLHDIYMGLISNTSYFEKMKEISKDSVKSNIDAIKNSARITNAIKYRSNFDIKRIKRQRDSTLKTIKLDKKDDLLYNNADLMYSKNSIKGRINSLYLRYLSIDLKFEYIKKKQAINIVSWGIKVSYVVAIHIIAFLKKIESGKLSDEELIKYADDKLYGIPQKILMKKECSK